MILIGYQTHDGGVLIDRKKGGNMAEIDGTNPLSPVWPQRPARKVEKDDPAKDEWRRQEQGKKKSSNKDEKDNGSFHIDEYV